MNSKMKRKYLALEIDDGTNPHIFKREASEEMKRNIEKTFSNHIKTLIKRAKPLPEKQRLSVDLSNHSNWQMFTEVPLFTRDFENSVLRPPKENESACENGEGSCECKIIAKCNPFLDVSHSFVGVSLHKYIGENICLLCARKNMTQQYYRSIFQKKQTGSQSVQLFRNQIETNNEYRKEACLIPNAKSTNFFDPVVLHQRSNYLYEKTDDENSKRIYQRNVFFSFARQQVNTISFVVEDGNSLKHGANAKKTIQKIIQEQDWKKRIQMEMQLFMFVPEIYNGEQNLLWNKILTSISNCGVYLPFVFCNEKTIKNVPIVHLISKGLPQRSQFRNFANIAIDSIKDAEFLLFFKTLFCWCISGLHFKWNTVFMKLERRIQLYEFLIVKDGIDWKQFFTQNIRLMFFMVKEFFCFLVLNQPSLRTILVEDHEWATFEQDVFKTMNDVRLLFNTETIPFKHILSLIQKYMPKHLFENKDVVSTASVMVKAISGNYDMPNVSAENLDELYKIRDVHYAILLQDEKAFSFKERLCETKSPAKIIATLAEYETAQIRQKIVNYYVMEYLCENIGIYKLPYHYAEKQLSVVCQRHDLVPTPNSIKNATSLYFCLCCEDIKVFYANISNVQKKAGTCVTSFGHLKLSYHPEEDKCFCIGSTNRKKSKLLSCDNVPCLKICMFGNMVRFFNKYFILCSNCGCVCQYAVNDDYLLDNKVVCGFCNNKKEKKQSLFCDFCLRKSSNLQFYPLYDDECPKNENPWKRVGLCPRHNRSRFKLRKCLLKSSLFNYLKRNL